MVLFFFLQSTLSASLSLAILKKKVALTKATFFLNSPHLSLHTSFLLSLHATVVDTSLYYALAAGSESEVKEHHLLSGCDRDKGNSHHVTPLCHMSFPSSVKPLKLKLMWCLLQMSFFMCVSTSYTVIELCN